MNVYMRKKQPGVVETTKGENVALTILKIARNLEFLNGVNYRKLNSGKDYEIMSVLQKQFNILPG